MEQSGQTKVQLQQDIACPDGKTLVEQLRSLVLLRQGASGIKGIGMMFRTFDNDRNRTLNKEEFRYGIMDRLGYNFLHVDTLFEEFDRDGSGIISYDEFLRSLRPEMNERRLELINKAFDKMDSDGSGVITVDDLDSYDVRNHPKFQSGEWTATRCRRQFLDSFDIEEHKDGKVTKDEFLDYYAGVSASIDHDAYFDLMMRRAWQL